MRLVLIPFGALIRELNICPTAMAVRKAPPCESQMNMWKTYADTADNCGKMVQSLPPAPVGGGPPATQIEEKTEQENDTVEDNQDATPKVSNMKTLSEIRIPLLLSATTAKTKCVAAKSSAKCYSMISAIEEYNGANIEQASKYFFFDFLLFFFPHGPIEDCGTYAMCK